MSYSRLPSKGQKRWRFPLDLDCVRVNVVGVGTLVIICVITTLICQQLITASESTGSHISVGRSIQSLLRFDDRERPRNISQDIGKHIENVLRIQRRLISEEMNGYVYPKGKYNVSASKLSDLVPEKGGTPVRSIVLTTWRSGSTFLGDILDSHPGNYYHYEPLLQYEIVQIRGPPLWQEAKHLVHSLLNCNYTTLTSYLQYGMEHNYLFTHNSRLWEMCMQFPELCFVPEFLNSFCRLFPFQSMKIVRVRLKLFQDLLDDPTLNLRVLLLIRDPRGILQSRKHRVWCPGNPDCTESSRLCADMVSDYSAALKFSKKYKNRFKVMRYEDISLDPYKSVSGLFSFFGLDLHPKVIDFLDTHTKVDIGGVSSTYRDSKSAPFHWRNDLTFEEVDAIQGSCKSALRLWGYKNAVNASHQKSFIPISKQFTFA
ncbi:hypothetical protein M8J76_002057 [Diaphorina citri]|nr:hypothetical protein M8J75_013845 [Diaphorina citri]KAI5744416.1 hypothetical protein M8J76_002057 [Diaphorina citri]KAI5751167.1 hypothetical protein M8J77_004997 [Diaphorina citri]